MASDRAAAAEVIDLTNSDDEPGSTARKSVNSAAPYSLADANPQLRTNVLRNMHMTGAQRGSPSSPAAATINAGSEQPPAASPTPRSSSAQMNTSVPHRTHSNSSPPSPTRTSPSSFITAQRNSITFAASHGAPSSPASSFGRDQHARGLSSSQPMPTSDAQSSAPDERARSGPVLSQQRPYLLGHGHQQEQPSSSTPSSAAAPRETAPAASSSSSTSRPQGRSGPVHPAYVKPVPPIRLSPEDADSLDAAGNGMGIRHGPRSQYYSRRPDSPSSVGDRLPAHGLLPFASSNAHSAAQFRPHSMVSHQPLHQPHQQLRQQQQPNRMYPSTSSPRWSAPQPNASQQQQQQQHHQQQSQQRPPSNPSAYPSPTLPGSPWTSAHHHTPSSQGSQLPGNAPSLSPHQNQQPNTREPHTSQPHPQPHFPHQHQHQHHCQHQHQHQHQNQHQHHQHLHQLQHQHQHQHQYQLQHQQQHHRIPQQHTHPSNQQHVSSQQQQHHQYPCPHHAQQQQQHPSRQTGQPPAPAVQILPFFSSSHRQPPSPSTDRQPPHLLGSKQSSLNASAFTRQSLPHSLPHAKNLAPHVSSPARKTSSSSHFDTSSQEQPNPGRSAEVSGGQSRDRANGSYAGSVPEGTCTQHMQRSSGHWPHSTTQSPGNSADRNGARNDIAVNDNSSNPRFGPHHYAYTRRPPLSAGGQSIVQDGSADRNVPHLTRVLPAQTPPGSRPTSASSRVLSPTSASKAAGPKSAVDMNITSPGRPSQNAPGQGLSRTPPSRQSPAPVPLPVSMPVPSRPSPSSQARTSSSQSQPDGIVRPLMDAFLSTPSSASTAANDSTPRPVRTAPVAKPLSKASDWSVPKLESALRGFLHSLQVDHGVGLEYSIDMAQPRVRKDVSSFDDFADMPAKHADSSSSETVTVRWKLHRDNQRRPEGRVSHVQVTPLKSPGQRVPRYRFHHVEIAKNILSPNTPLKFIPHIRDLEDGSEDKYKYDQWIEELESMERKSGFDSSARSDKWATTRHQEFIKLLSGYLDRWISSLCIENCSKTTLIRYMANESRNGQATITPQQKNSLLMSCGGDAATPQAMMIASMFTDAFNRVFKSDNVKLHDVLKQDETVENVLEPKKTTKTKDQDKNDSIEQVQQYLGTYTSLKCMICNTHSCEHGEFDSENVRRCFSIDDLGSKLWKHVERRRNRQIKEQQARSKAMYGAVPANGSSSGHAAMWKPCNNHCYQSYDIGDSALITREWTEDETNLVRSFHLTFANSSGKVPCTVCSMINRNCWEVYRHMKELRLSVSLRPPTPPEVVNTPPVKQINWYNRKQRMLYGDWSEHTITHFHALREQREPCNHDGPCTAARDCPCVKAKILCERFCRCTADCCVYKFTGCACHGSGKTCYARQKEGKPCICVQLNRECDPILCGGCGARQRADPEHRDNDELHATGCQNVSLQRGKSKSVVLGQSQLEGCGYGLFTAEDIGADEFIIEYIGELITHDEGVRREARRGDVFNQESNASYLFTLLEQDGIWVDAAIYGNLSRYINHASEHDKRGCNITPKIMYVNGEFRIRFSAMRDIKAGEELFFNYGENFPNLTKKLLEDKASASDDEDMSNAGQGGNTGGARGGNSKARANRNRNNKNAGAANSRRKVQTTRAPTKSVQSTGPAGRAGASGSSIRKRVRGKGARKEAPPATAPAIVDMSSGEDDDDDDDDDDVDEADEADYAASQMDVDDPPSAPTAASKRAGTKRKRRTVHDNDDEDTQMGGADDYAGDNDNDDNTDSAVAGPRRRRKRYQPSSQPKPRPKPQPLNLETTDNDNDDGDGVPFSSSRAGKGLRNTRRRSGPGRTTAGPTPAEIAAATGGVVNIFADGLEVPRRRRKKRSTADATGGDAINMDGANDDDEPSITAVRLDKSKAAQAYTGSSSLRHSALRIELPTVSQMRRTANAGRNDSSPTASNSYTDNDDLDLQPRQKRLRARLGDSSYLAAADSDDSSLAGGSTAAGPVSRPTSRPVSKLRRARQHLRVPDSADDETSEFDIANYDDDDDDENGNASSAPASAVVALGTTDNSQGSAVSAGQFYGQRQGQGQSGAGTPTSPSANASIHANTAGNATTGRRRQVVSDSDDDADETVPSTDNNAAAPSIAATSLFSSSQSTASSVAAGRLATSRPRTPQPSASASTSVRGGGDDDGGGSEVSSSVERSQRRRQKPARYRGEQ